MGGEQTNRPARIKSVGVALATFIVAVVVAISSELLTSPSLSLAVLAIAVVIGVVGITYSKMLLRGAI